MTSGISFSDIAKEFREESLELLEAMENSLVTIRENGMDDEAINAVFRAAHTIKGTAGMYKIDFIVEFTHIAENLLDQVRNGKVEMNDELGELFLECKDHMQNLVEFAVATDNNEDPSDELTQVTKSLGGALSANLAGGAVEHHDHASVKQVKASTQEKSWKLNIVFGAGVLEHGFEPASFLAYLRKNSSEFECMVDVSTIPVIGEYEPTVCYIGCRVDFSTRLSEEEILDVFEFIRDDCKLSLSEKACEVEVVQPELIQTKEIAKKSTAAPTTQAQNSYSIRVDAEKIDQLINLIGEMVIANANVVQQSIDMQNSDLVESVSIVSRMLEDIRESAMQIRMVQIGETFNRFKRIVMDLSKKLGKDVELIIKGGDTELDKTVIEKINDPLVHIVRNAIDHGLELPHERTANGKHAKGSITLNAYHDAGTVVIEIKDDGKGLDEELIRAKAIEKGIIEEGAVLNQKQIFELILQPGFSTAAAVTDLSGRGVGMDVVKRNIEALRGNIEITSKVGEGTSFIIRLPLTLAIIDGFLVKVGETFYVIPLEMVIECLELGVAYKKDMHGNNYINLRGNVLPLLNVSDYFDEKKTDTKRENIVVVQYAGRRFGFIVDELYGEFQTVIKPLGRVFSNLRGISGATILGSGNVALILDIPVLGNHVANIASNQSKSGGGYEP
jgi:two-component system, chemotaxis family, sensor kinase CheA